jgi:hypothetical protein
MPGSRAIEARGPGRSPATGPGCEAGAGQGYGRWNCGPIGGSRKLGSGAYAAAAAGCG